MFTGFRCYLEISARRSGKTTRLISHMVNFLKTHKDKRVVLTMINRKMIRLVRRMEGVRELENRIVFISAQSISRFLSECERLLCGQNKEDFHYYFDEFDLMKNDEYLFIDGYFVTTPVWMRTKQDVIEYYDGQTIDLLLECIERAKSYKAYLPLTEMPPLKYFTDQGFAMDVYGCWYKPENIS